jgi:hypothetical protein
MTRPLSRKREVLDPQPDFSSEQSIIAFDIEGHEERFMSKWIG